MKKGQVSKVKKAGSYTKSILRYSIIAFLLLVQMFLVFVGAYYLNRYVIVVYFVLELLSMIITFPLISQERDAAYKIYWMGVLLLLPVAGHIMYLLWGRMLVNRRTHKQIQQSIDAANEYQRHDASILQRFGEKYPEKEKAARYLYNQNYPIYHNTDVKYFRVGEEAFADMMEKLEGATSYIFMSFFIIADGEILEKIRKILEERLQAGVEICIMYDDAGSMLQLSDSTVEALKRSGMKVKHFNPVDQSYQRLFMNYRNHQKILVIDGRFAYTGGINISDRYANINSPFGHWKDTGVRLEGDAVYGMLLQFIGMWNTYGDRLRVEDYSVPVKEVKGGGYCQPFADGPSNNPSNPAKDMFLEEITGAREYVNIMTPYLIIDDTMQEILSLTARAGVKVRIITPGIPDKKTVLLLTRRHYGPLLKAGVRIFEYTPGFVHAKLCSNEYSAIIGSVNMDYRSFYLHYENGVWIPEGEVLSEIENDFEETVQKSREITYEEWKNRPFYIKVLQEMLYFIKCQL